MTCVQIKWLTAVHEGSGWATSNSNKHKVPLEWRPLVIRLDLYLWKVVVFSVLNICLP